MNNIVMADVQTPNLMPLKKIQHKCLRGCYERLKDNDVLCEKQHREC